jgi:hypothetical protein
LIDEARRGNVFGPQITLNKSIEFGDAFDFTFAHFTGWCEEAASAGSRRSRWPAR